MSWWTQVLGVIEVIAPGRTQAECRYLVDTVLDHMPLVTGSEGCTHAQAIQRDGYNSSSSHDEFCMKTNNLTDYYGDKSRRRGFLQTQTNYLIVIDGSLRDRMFNETKHELMKWLCRLAKRLIVHNISITLAGDTGHLVITDPEPYFEMYECDDELCWTDYLMWERDPYSGLPLQLSSKYYDDEEIKSELKRREEWRERR